MMTRHRKISAKTAPKGLASEPMKPRREDRVPASSMTRLDYMLSVMRDPAADPRRRDAMAKLALPYLHPKPKTIDPGKGNLPIELSEMSEIETARRVAFLLTSAARKKMEQD